MDSTNCDDFSLNHTINSGQFFYYFENDDFYYIVHRNEVFRVKQENNILYFNGIEENKIRDFFQLDFNLNQLKAKEDDYNLLYSIEKYWGLRIIKQDLWQCIISFVCSAAANVDKIKKNVNLISKYFGEEVIFENKTFYKFPEPGKINNLDLLIQAKTGYRAKFIYQINEMVKNNPNLLDEIKTSDFETAKELLMKFPGVGSKIADCIMLFSLQDYEAFPVDTWIKKIFNKYYLDEELNPKQIEKVIENYFPKGAHRGILQQYLFHKERNM